MLVMIEYFSDDIHSFIQNIELFIAGIGSVIFSIIYLGWYKWWSTAAGRSVALLMLTLNVIFVNNAVRVVLGHDYDGQDIVRYIAYTLSIVSTWYLVYTLVTAHTRARKLYNDRKPNTVDYIVATELASDKRKWYNHIMITKIQEWAKAVVALVGAAMTAVAGIVPIPDDISVPVQIALAVLTAFATWAIPNAEPKDTNS